MVEAPVTGRLTSEHGVRLPGLGQLEELGAHLFAGCVRAAERAAQGLVLAGRPAGVLAEEGIPFTCGSSESHHRIASHRLPSRSVVRDTGAEKRRACQRDVK